MDKVEAFLTKIEDDQSYAIDQANDPSLYMGDANKLIDLVRVYREANKQANMHCEAIAISSLYPPMEGESFSGGFFCRQATKSVGSGGRAHAILSDAEAKAEEIIGE